LRSISGLASAVVPIGDDGRRLCKPRLSVALSGPGGYRATVARRLDTILPGDTIAYPVPWPDTLVPGAYTAVARTACGGHTATVNNSIDLSTPLTGANSPERTVPSGHGGTGIPGWALLGVASIGVIAGILLARRPRRNRAPSAARPSGLDADGFARRRGPSAVGFPDPGANGFAQRPVREPARTGRHRRK